MKTKNEKELCCETSSDVKNFVGLAAALMGIFACVAFGVLIFAPTFGAELVAISWAFAVFGMVCAFFMYKTSRKDEKKK